MDLKLTNNQVATALRPFYFEIHPDRFWRFPDAKRVNESSLKQLNQQLEELASGGRVAKRLSVRFYARKDDDTQELKVVDIEIDPESNLNSTIKRILSKFDLDLKYINQFSKKTSSPTATSDNIEWLNRMPHNYEQDYATFIKITQQLKVKKKETLISYLAENIDKYRVINNGLQPIRDDIVAIRHDLITSWHLKDIVFESSWSINSFKSALVNLRTLLAHHGDKLRDKLADKTIIFGNKSGLTVSGDLILSIQDVRQNWLMYIKNIDDNRHLVNEIPKLEQRLSSLLNGMQVSRRKFQGTKLINEYKEQLERLIRNLTKHHRHAHFNGKGLQLVIESEAGPLMVSPTGQIIAPSSCPGDILCEFVANHGQEARRLTDLYNQTKHIEADYITRVINELQVRSISKDDNVTPDLMINCLISLLNDKSLLQELLFDTRLFVSQYYAVQQSGDICIPYNFTLK